MTRSIFFAAALLSALTAAGVSACSDTSTNTPASEFIAKDADVATYDSWTQTTTPRTGADPAGKLFGAHEEADTNLTRYIRISSAGAARGSNGQYPSGTILLKEMKLKNGTIVGITGMAKRGGEYSKANNGWEYMFVDPTTRKITSRGDTLMGGGCRGCHEAVKDRDYTFTK